MNTTKELYNKTDKWYNTNKKSIEEIRKDLNWRETPMNFCLIKKRDLYLPTTHTLSDLHVLIQTKRTLEAMNDFNRAIDNVINSFKNNPMFEDELITLESLKTSIR